MEEMPQPDTGGRRIRKAVGTMKKHISTIEEAVNIYTSITGKTPTEPEIESLYHRYRADAKHYNGFDQWMRYNNPA